MKLFATFSFCLFIVLVLVSCRENHEMKDTYLDFYYKQTACADPWKTGSTDSLTLVNVVHYLDSLGLYIAGLNIVKDDNQEICSACTCKTGKTIYVSTLKSDIMIAKYKAIGFREH